MAATVQKSEYLTGDAHPNSLIQVLKPSDKTSGGRMTDMQDTHALSIPKVSTYLYVSSESKGSANSASLIDAKRSRSRPFFSFDFLFFHPALTFTSHFALMKERGGRPTG